MLPKLILALVALIAGMGVIATDAKVIHTDCDAGKRPYRISGNLKIDGREFRFVSGGKGWSIPYGDYEITPDDVGKWGRRHGALGLNHDDGITDPQLHRDREGIEIHSWPGDTAGCIGIPRDYKALKQLTLAMIKQYGHAYLHVWPCRVEITSDQR